jgi:hypothetical protein
MFNNMGLIVALPILLTIAIMAIVFVPLIRRSMQNGQLMKTGETAQGVILSVGQTGMYINEQPQLKIIIEVRPANRPPFQAEVKKVVPLLQLAQMQPGQMVEVKYDPNNTSKVALSAMISGMNPMMGGGMPMGGMNPMMGGMGMGNAQAQYQQMIMQNDQISQQLLATGQQADAFILTSNDTGVMVNGGNMFKTFMLDVRPFNQAPFQAQAMAVVRPESLAKLAVGARIQVRYNPANPTQVAIVPLGN